MRSCWWRGRHVHNNWSHWPNSHPCKNTGGSSCNLSMYLWNFASLLPVYMQAVSTLTSFGRFILIFNKMVLMFLRVGYLSFLPFQHSSFNKSDCLDFIDNDEWPQFTQPKIHWIIRFGSNAGVLTKAATDAKTSSRVLKCTLLNLVCLTIDNAMKDYHKRL